MAMTQCPECNGSISDKAVTCPHCGYPLKGKEAPEETYKLYLGNRTTSNFANYLRGMAWLTWIGGLIIAIFGANVTRYFSFPSFISLFVPFVVYGFILMSMGTIVEQISMTYDMISGISLRKEKGESKSAHNSFLGSSKSSSSGSSRPATQYIYDTAPSKKWTCKVCGKKNQSWDESCAYCGEKKTTQKDASETNTAYLDK